VGEGVERACLREAEAASLRRRQAAPAGTISAAIHFRVGVGFKPMPTLQARFALYA